MISQLFIDIENAFYAQRISAIKKDEEEYIDLQKDEFLKDLASFSTGCAGYFVEIKPANENFIQLHIYVNDADDAATIFKIIATSEYTQIIKKLRFFHKGGHANGTVELYFVELLSYNSFPNLDFFYTQHYSKDGSLIASMDGGFDEGGLGGKILDSMPQLRTLNLVSAPNENFFQREFHPIETLEVRAGYDNNNFLERLSGANCFPKLKHFSYQDINIAFHQSTEDSVLTFEVIEKFMESKNFPELEVLSLIELKLTEQQIEKLKNTHLGRTVKTLVLANQRDEGYENSEEYKQQRDWFINTYFSY